MPRVPGWCAGDSPTEEEKQKTGAGKEEEKQHAVKKIETVATPTPKSASLGSKTKDLVCLVTR